MAIRLKYDAGLAVIPEDKAQQRFGQQLVQQQQKYANDQRQDIQTRAYDQQRLGMQNAAQANLMAMQGQQALERMNQAQQFGVQQNEAAQAAQMQQRDLGVFDTQLKTLNGMAQDALKNPNMPMDSKRRIQELLVGKGAVNGARFDDQQRQQYLSGYQKEMSGLLSQMQPEDPQHVKDNKGLSHYVPSLGRFASPDELTAMKKENPSLEVHAFQDGKMLPAPTPPKEQPKIPKSYEEHVGVDVVKAQKELDAMKERMRGQAEDAGNPYTDEDKLRADATAALKGDYDHLLGLNAAKIAGQAPAAQGQTSQAGQSAMPPAGQSSSPTPLLDQAAASITAADAYPPSQLSQPSKSGQKPWVPWSDRAVGEEYVDLDGSVLVKTPTGVISKGKVPPGTPLPVEAGSAPPDQSMSQTARDVAAADAAVSDSVPPVAAEQASLDALFPQDNTSPASQQQNPWMELAAPEQQKPAEQQTTPMVAPDFGKLTASATDDSDRAVFGKLQGMYDKQSPEIQNAISILVDSSKLKKERAAAALYLKNAGIDLEKLAGPKVDDATKRLNQYQKNSTTTMR